jgi:hypothetical protein
VTRLVRLLPSFPEAALTLSLGYGYHADFITGWDQDFLQQAVDTCTNPSGNIEDCPIFTIQEEWKAAKCQFELPKTLSDDDCEGPADGLCGNVPIQDGPAYASVIDGGNKEKPSKPIISEPPAVPTLSWAPAKSAVTDKYGGGISVAAVNPSPAADVANADAAGEEPAPVVTPAPEAAPAEPAKGKILSTSTYTSAGVVHEVVIEEVPVYVTVDAPPARRHAHAHRLRRDREHGILGRRI